MTDMVGVLGFLALVGWLAWLIFTDKGARR